MMDTMDVTVARRLEVAQLAKEGRCSTAANRETQPIFGTLRKTSPLWELLYQFSSRIHQLAADLIVLS